MTTTRKVNPASLLVKTYLSEFQHQSVPRDAEAFRTAFRALKHDGVDVSGALAQLESLEKTARQKGKGAIGVLIDEACQKLARGGNPLAESAMRAGRTRPAGTLSAVGARVKAVGADDDGVPPPDRDAILSDPDLLARAATVVRSDVPFVIESIDKDLRAFAFAAESAQLDPKVLEAAYLALPEGKRKAPFEPGAALKAVASSLLEGSPDLFANMPQPVRADQGICFEVMQKSVECLPHVDPSVWEDDAFMLKTLKKWDSVKPYVPAHKRNNPGFMAQAIEARSTVGELLHKDLLANSDFVAMVVEKDSEILRHAHPLRDNPAFVASCVRTNLDAYLYAGEEAQIHADVLRAANGQLKEGSKVDPCVLEAVILAVAEHFVADSWNVFGRLPGCVRAHPGLARRAVKKYSPAVKDVHPRLWEDDDFALFALEESSAALEYFPKHKLDDPTFMAQVVKVRVNAYKAAGPTARSHPELVAAVVCKEPNLLNKMPREFRNSQQFIQNLICEHDLWGSDLLAVENPAVQRAYEQLFAQVRSPDEVPPELREPFQKIQRAVLNHPVYLLNAPRILREDEALMIAIARTRGIPLPVLQDLDQDGNANLAVALANVSSRIGPVKDSRFSESRAFLKLAIMMAPAKVLAEAPPEIRNDPEIVRMAVLIEANALQHASKELRGDPDFLSDLIGIQPACLPHTAEKIRERKDLCLPAVSFKGELLECLSVRLRNDPEVVRAAVDNEPKAFKFAGWRVKSDPQMVMSLNKEAEVLEWGMPVLRSHPDIAIAEIENRPEAMTWLDPELVLEPNFQAAVRDLGNHRADQALDKAIKDAREVLDRASRLPVTRESSPAWAWWSPAGVHTVEDVLDDAALLAEDGVYPSGVALPSFEQAVRWIEISKGRILPSQLAHTYDEACALYNDLNPSGPKLDTRLSELCVDGEALSWTVRIHIDGEDVGRLTVRSKGEGGGYIDYFKLAPHAQGAGVKPFLFTALFNLCEKLKHTEVSLSPGLSMGKYVWARDFFDARPGELENVKRGCVAFLRAHEEDFVAAGISAESVSQAADAAGAVQHMWEIAALRFPQTNADANDHGGAIWVDTRSAWGLQESHHLGAYHPGKLYLLSEQPSWGPAIKDLRQGLHGVQMQLTYRSYLQTMVEMANESREARGEGRLSALAVEELSQRMRAL